MARSLSSKRMDARSSTILMRRHGPFAFVAFDVLEIDGRDVRRFPLIERKQLMRSIVPADGKATLYAQHVAGRGRELFAAVCAQDLEGIVAKRADGLYDIGPLTTWTKIKNRAYSQAVDRHELFER